MWSLMKRNMSLPQTVSLMLLLVAAFLYPVLLTRQFYQHMAILICMYSILGVAWNFIGGEAGQISFGQAIFFGIGAYTVAVLGKHFSLNPWLGLIAGAFLAIAVSWVIGKPTFKLSGTYFTIATLAFGEIAVVLVRRWKWIGGAVGIYMPMQEEGWLNFQFHNSKLPYYYIILVFLLLTVLAACYVRHSKLGFYFRAIRSDEIAARSLGIDVPKYKLIAYGLSAFFAAVAGGFYAQYALFIDPDSAFSSALSLQYAFICIFGGIGTLSGPIIGAVALISMQQAAMAFLSSSNAAHLIIYGFLILLIALYEPNGLVAVFKSLISKFLYRRSSKNASA